MTNSSGHVVPLRQIRVDPTLQPRLEGLDDAHLAALIEAPDAWPPITLASLEGRLTLIDGFHRFEAARRLNYDTIRAIVVTPPPDGDLFRLAFELNATHGKPLSLRDRKAYACGLLAKRPDFSDREIARRTGLNHETVGAMRAGSQTYRSVAPTRKPGALPGDVGLFDPVRFSRATRAQKSVAGYIQRLATALGDPYTEDAAVPWSDNPADIAQDVLDAMGAERAATLFETLESDARFLLKICASRSSLTSNTQRKAKS